MVRGRAMHNGIRGRWCISLVQAPSLRQGRYVRLGDTQVVFFWGGNPALNHLKSYLHTFVLVVCK